MKISPLVFWSATAALVAAGCATRRAKSPLPTASHVDLRRYAGKWYEIARLPNFFQRDDSNATAEYTVQPDGTVRVVNTEFRPDGSSKVAEGSATAVADGSYSRLRVKFRGLAALAPTPSEGNYWIIKLRPDYSVVLVGTPNRKYLWLLARRPDLPGATRRGYLDSAKTLGFDVDKMRLADWKTPVTSS